MIWWFDIDNKICRVEMDIGYIKPTITFDGDLKAQFVESKVFHNGCSYIYETELGNAVSLNDVKSKGERYVSLYIDRRLVKEYNVRAEKYKARYMENPAIFDYKRKFIAKLLPASALIAVFMAFISALALSFLGVIFSFPRFFAVAGGLSAFFFACAALALILWYATSRAQMERYAIISSINKRKKKKPLRRKKFR